MTFWDICVAEGNFTDQWLSSVGILGFKGLGSGGWGV